MRVPALTSGSLVRVDGALELDVRLQFDLEVLLLVGAALAVSAVIISALFTRFSGRLQLPGAVLFLVVGMGVGSEGLGLIPLDQPELVQIAGVLALLVILLEGGLTTKPTDLRLAAVPGILLATVGVVVTAAVTALGVYLLLDVDPVTAGLIGAVVGSTDAAAVFSMMRTTPLPRRTSALLRVESGSNDPVAVMLTVGLLATYDEAFTALEWVTFAAQQLFGGGLVGAAVGYGAVLLLRRVRLGIEGLYPITVLALGGLAYGLAEVLGASGFVAVYVTGVLIGGMLPRYRRSVLGFHEALANAAEIALFLLLGLLVFPSRLLDVAVPALMVAAVLTLVARPVAVWLCTAGQGYRWPERTLLSVGGLKGAVPIILATFTLTAGIPEGDLLFDIVFFVVLVSVLVQGVSLLPAVRALGLEETRPAWAPVAQSMPLEGFEVDLVELQVTADLILAGRVLAETDPPAGAVVTTIVRGQQVLVPDGATVVLHEDVLLITVQRGRLDADALTAWARGERNQPPG